MDSRRPSVDLVRLAKLYGADYSFGDDVDEEGDEEDERYGKARAGSGVLQNAPELGRERRGALGTTKGVTVKTERKTPSQTVRGMVSKNKIRFQEDGFDLDLTYITPRMVAMGFPSSGTEGYYRNQIDDVERFFSTRHQEHYRVYNLCSERTYDTHARFGGHHVRFPFDDHNPPVPISLIPCFVEDAMTWLEEHTSNVIAVHCKAGKGRTGMMLGALLLSQAAENSTYMSAQEALVIFGKARTHDGKGVTIPSQIRYLGYWEKILNNNGGHLPPHRKFDLEYFRIFSLKDKIDLYFTVTLGEKDNKKEIYDSRKDFTSKSANKDTGYHFDLLASHIPVVVTGDVLFKVKKSKMIGNDETLFHFWVNVDVEGWDVNDMKVCLVKHEIDKAVKDKAHELYKKELSIEMSFIDHSISSPNLRGGASSVSPIYSPTRGPMSPSTVALPARYSPSKTPLLLSPAIGPSSLLSPPVSPDLFPIDFQFPSNYSAQSPTKGRKRTSSGKEITGYLSISKMRASTLVLPDDCLTDRVRCKITVGTTSQTSELATIVNSTVLWRPQGNLKPFFISKNTSPSIDFEVFDSTNASIASATVHLFELLPPFMEWGDNVPIRMLAEMWTSGAMLEGNGEGNIHVQGMFDPHMKPDTVSSYCVVALAGAVAQHCYDGLVHYAKGHSNVSFIRVESPSASPISSFTGSPMNSCSSSPRVDRQLQLLRALQSANYDPPQAFLGTFQHKRDGVRKSDTFMLQEEQLIRYEERDRIDLTLLDGSPVVFGDYGIKLDDYELRCKSTLERNKWLQLLASTPTPGDSGTDRDSRRWSRRESRADAITSRGEDIVILVEKEKSRRTSIEAEAAWAYSEAQRRYFAVLLKQTQMESATLAAHARRLQNTARRHELEKRKWKQAELLRLEIEANNATRVHSRSESSSSPVPNFCSVSNGSPLSDGQKSPASDYPSDVSEPGTPGTVGSIGGKHFARAVKLCDVGCQTAAEVPIEDDVLACTIKQEKERREISGTVVAVVAATAGWAACRSIDARRIVQAAEDGGKLEAWVQKRDEVANHWRVVERGDEACVESEKAMRNKLTKFLVGTVMMMRRNAKERVLRVYTYKWRLWLRRRSDRKVVFASPPSLNPSSNPNMSPLLGMRPSAVSPVGSLSPVSSPSPTFEPSRFTAMPPPSRRPSVCHCMPYQVPSPSSRRCSLGHTTQRCSKCWRSIEL